MGKIHYEYPVKCAHGKIDPNGKVGFAKRKASGNTYSVYREDWKMHYTTPAKQQAAVAAQAKFRAVAASARERMADPTKQAIDAVGFAGQSKYTTMYGYCFKKEWDAFEGD